jgi:hypothetical protein
MKPRASKYGLDLTGNPIEPKDGERILEEGESLPERYRPWINGSGWIGVAKLHTHPGANTVARVFGNYWAYAVPIKARVAKVQHVEENPPEAVLDVPEVVSESAPEINNVDAVQDVPAPQTPIKKTRKRKSLPFYTNEIVFDDD